MSDLRRTLLWSAGMLLVGGVGGGLAWLWLADPAQWEVTEQGIILDEEAVRAQFSVVVTFIAIGAVLGFAWAWAAGRALLRLGWLLVPVFIVVSTGAALIAWRVGVMLGPVDPRDVADPALGGRLPSPLEIDAVAPFVVWAMFALGGLLWATWLDRGSRSAGDGSEHGVGETGEVVRG